MLVYINIFIKTLIIVMYAKILNKYINILHFLYFSKNYYYLVSQRGLNYLFQLTVQVKE